MNIKLTVTRLSLDHVLLKLPFKVMHRPSEINIKVR